MTRVLPAVPPDVMTWRARGYLGIAAARHLAAGAYIVTVPGDFTADAYQVIREILPMRVWGLLFLAGGIHMAYAALAGREPHARTGLTMSAVASGSWAAGFFMSYFVGGIVTLLGGIIFTALTLAGSSSRSDTEEMVSWFVGGSTRCWSRSTWG